MSHAARTPPFGPVAAAALLAGVVACLLAPMLLPWRIAATLLLAGCAVWWRAPRAWWIGPVFAGFGWAALHAAHALDARLPAGLERQEVEVTGRIAELPVHEPRRTAFLFDIDEGDGVPASLRGRRVRLSWYDARGGRDAMRGTLRAGQRWGFVVRLRAPRGLRNPGGADAEKYALARRLAATGSVRRPAQAERLSGQGGLDAWRERMSGRIGERVGGASSRFVRALALGDTRGLDDADWSVLRANGLTHLIAISGFHVGLVAGFFALLARAVWWLWPVLARRWPLPIAAALMAFTGAALYTAAVGFALPTVRTTLMIGAVASARAMRRSSRVTESLALAAVVVLAVDPLAVLGAGFWLSFAGVLWLCTCLPTGGERDAKALVRGFLSAQAVATVGLLPLGVLLFGQASVAGPVANLVAVPWWSLVVVPLSLLGLGLEALWSGAGTHLWKAAAWCFDTSWPLFTRLAESPLALAWLPESRWYAVPLALIGAFWLLLPRGVPGRPLAVLLWLPLLWPDRGLPRHGEAELRVMDVGQGLSVLVRTSGHTLLYDTGPAVPDGYDAGERAVVPALHALGVRALDRIVLSHGDSDHAGGLAAVRTSFAALATLAPEGSPVSGARPCQAGQHWTWDGVRFRFLHPTPYFPYLGNEASCVLRIDTVHGSALLTGDIGEIIEREIVRRDPAGVRADVVFVAHHGSAGSSDPMFVTASGARHAIVSSGFGNLFRHPRPQVVERWETAGAQLHDTARGGALRIRLAIGGVSVETRRTAQPRLWDAEARLAHADAGLSYRPD